MCCLSPKHIICFHARSGKSKIPPVYRRGINRDIPWAYFDGAAQGTTSRGGTEGIIYFSINHSISFKTGIGHQTNNY
jgi:hypothetical protein